MKRILAMMLAVLMLCLVGCGNKAADVEIDVASVYAEMEGILPEMVVLDQDRMLNYCGIQVQHFTQATVAVCSDGLRADEIWLIEAADADALKTLEELAEGRLTRKGEESITYSPEQYKVVENAETIVVGNYLAVIVSPDVDKLVEIFNQTAN